MSTRDCSANKGIVRSLKVTQGEFLRYEASFRGAQALFVVADPARNLIFGPGHGSGTPGGFGREWPDEGESVGTGMTTHTFGCQFLAAHEYLYRVTHRNENGDILDVLKDCKYTATDPADVVFSSLRIFVE
jgi:hypothetical protein